MTDYEAQTLALAKTTLSLYWVADCVAVFALIAALYGGFLGYRTLSSVVEQLKIARWNALLSFEQDMANRRSRFADVGAQLTTSASSTILQATYNEARESYFNSLDRLASSILNGHFPDAEMKQDYQEVFTSVIRTYPSDFATGTRYRKVVAIYEKWHS